MPTFRPDRTTTDINYKDTIEKLFGKNLHDSPRDHEKIKDHQIYKKFNEWTKKIQFIADNNGVPIGEIRKLIFTVFGFDWDQIPYGRYEEIYYYIRNSYDKRYEHIDPELHKYLLLTGYYNKSSTAISHYGLVSGYMQTLSEMMQNKRPKEDFLKLGIEISKL